MNIHLNQYRLALVEAFHAGQQDAQELYNRPYDKADQYAVKQTMKIDEEIAVIATNPCEECNGLGYIHSSPFVNAFEDMVATCASCRGSGIQPKFPDDTAILDVLETLLTQRRLRIANYNFGTPVHIFDGTVPLRYPTLRAAARGWLERER